MSRRGLMLLGVAHAIAVALLPSHLESLFALADVPTCMVNGVAFFTYNQMSFLVLSRVHVLTHAVANGFRRVATIIAAVLYFGTPVSAVTALGMALVRGAHVLVEWCLACNPRGLSACAGMHVSAVFRPSLACSCTRTQHQRLWLHANHLRRCRGCARWQLKNCSDAWPSVFGVREATSAAINRCQLLVSTALPAVGLFAVAVQRRRMRHHLVPCRTQVHGWLRVAKRGRQRRVGCNEAPVLSTPVGRAPRLAFHATPQPDIMQRQLRILVHDRCAGAVRRNCASPMAHRPRPNQALDVQRRVAAPELHRRPQVRNHGVHLRPRLSQPLRRGGIRDAVVAVVVFLLLTAGVAARCGCGSQAPLLQLE